MPRPHGSRDGGADRRRGGTAHHLRHGESRGSRHGDPRPAPRRKTRRQIRLLRARKQVNPAAARAARLLVVSAIFLTSCSTMEFGGSGAAHKVYLNPVLDRAFPDPAVLKAADGWIYAYGTQGESGGRVLNIQ